MKDTTMTNKLEDLGLEIKIYVSDADGSRTIQIDTGENHTNDSLRIYVNDAAVFYTSDVNNVEGMYGSDAEIA